MVSAQTLHLFGLTLLASSVLGGEIYLYGHSCPNAYVTILSALESTRCVKAPLSLGYPEVYNLSSSARTIGPTCTFNIYTDAACQKLSRTLKSAGQNDKCVSVDAGMQSYKVTCAASTKKSVVAVEGGLDNNENMRFSIHGVEAEGKGSAVPTAVQRRADPRIESGASYSQPPSKYRNAASGGHDILTYLYIRGNTVELAPSGSSSAAGLKLASTLMQRVPDKVASYSTSIASGGTLYTIYLNGHGSYTAEQAVATVGQAALSSILADTVSYLQQFPDTWFTYSLDASDIDEQVGNINVTYIVNT